MVSDSSGLAPDCAIVALEETFSLQPRQHGRTVSFPAPRHAKSIHDCPAEVLVMFFKFIYTKETLMMWDRLEWQKIDVSSPSLFPYTIATVCSFWRDIMSSVPQFWTRIVTFVDSPTIPQSVIASQLLWSRDLPLDVIVTRRNLDHPVESRHERKQVMSLMETVINPHIDRLQNLDFSVGFSSSLPSFPDDFHGTATKLRRLQLECREDDGGSTPSRYQCETVPSTESQYPALLELELDGRNYCSGCRRGVPWATKVPNVHALTISHYKPRAIESFPAVTFMFCLTFMQKLNILHINDVALSPGTHHLVPHAWLRLGLLHLSDLPDFRPIDEMLQVLQDAIEVKITRCAIGSPRSLGYDGPLELDEIDADQDLVPLLRAWDGYNLRIRNCPCFNDTVLDMMGTKNEDGEYVCASGAYELDISNCPNFSVAALKRLVAARLDAPPHTGQFDWICVGGDVPVLSVEDRLWFNERVPDFRYYEEFLSASTEV